jgi:Collagen triple helix repeat (20 copies)
MSRLRHPIRAIREPFGKAGLTVAILALVMALVGGAYAAGGLTKSQEKQVKKIAKKYAGKAGPAGAAGTNGTNGTNGKDGAPGTAGTNGTNGEPGEDGTDGADGKSVVVTPVVEGDAFICDQRGGATVEVEGGSPTEVCNGEEGEKGDKGDPWTVGGTLPPGATLSGTWAFSGSSNTEQFVPLSFSVPLPFTLPGSRAHHLAPAASHSTCNGTVNNPKAPPGELCVYTAAESPDMTRSGPVRVDFELGTNRTGALVYYTGVTAESYATGTWAVTGCDPTLPVGEPNKCP